MIISRAESWGSVSYDTNTHLFTYTHSNGAEKQPYVSKPIVLNIDLTLKCNMACYHCVARDMRKYLDQDLVVTKKLIEKVNESPFMVIVITGGEPLLEEHEKSLLDLICGLKEKGIVIDTNGTIRPSKNILNLLRSQRVLVRVSLDSIRPQDELYLRHFPGSRSCNEEAFLNKLKFISSLRELGIRVAIQSVLHKMNKISIQGLPDKLNEWKIQQWYIQRLIPNNKLSSKTMFQLKTDEYETMLDKLKESCTRLGIRCVAKRDRRHNCVFLLVGNGQVYTQAEKEGAKLRLGKIGEISDYFQYVSASEHSARYYEVKSRREEKGR